MTSLSRHLTCVYPSTDSYCGNAEFYSGRHVSDTPTVFSYSGHRNDSVATTGLLCKLLMRVVTLCIAKMPLKNISKVGAFDKVII